MGMVVNHMHVVRVSRCRSKKKVVRKDEATNFKIKNIVFARRYRIGRAIKPISRFSSGMNVKGTSRRNCVKKFDPTYTEMARVSPF